MDISITLGPDDDPVSVSVDDDHRYEPEVVRDWLRLAADTALRLHRELHPAETQ